MNQDAVESSTDSLLPTRQSLLGRLRDWQDHEGWREFFELYWRLIYKVARKSGLTDSQAQEVVQNTFIYLSRKLPRFRYDRTRGSFKSWLRVVTRSRIHAYVRSEHLGRSRMPEPLPEHAPEEDEGSEDWPEDKEDEWDQVWQREWETNLIETAMRRLRAKVSARQLLIFRTAALTDLPVAQVARNLGLSRAQVYLARHRVGKLFKAEVRGLRTEME